MRISMRGSARVCAPMVSPEAPKSRLPRRTASAALAGFLTVAAAVALVGPNVNIVLAEEDDRTVYLRILRAEHGRNFPRPTPAAQPIAPLPQAQRGLFQIPVRGPLRAILVPREDKRLNYQAYAPTRQPIVAGPFKADPFHAPAAREPRALRPVSAPPLAHSAIRSVTPAGIIPSGGDGQASLSRRSVCVRLCDGFFFPVGAYNGPQDNEAHGEAGVYAFNLGEGVNRVGPDERHPFVVRGFKEIGRAHV